MLNNVRSAIKLGLIVLLTQPSLLWNSTRQAYFRRVRRHLNLSRSNFVENKREAKYTSITAGISVDALLEEISRHTGVLVIYKSATRVGFGVDSQKSSTVISIIDHLVYGIDKTVTANSGKRRTFQWTIYNKQSGTSFLSLEIYEKRSKDLWVSGNSKNRIIRAVYRDIFSDPGLISADELLGAPSYVKLVRDKPVDVVYTWVNSSDPDWVQLFQKYSNNGQTESIRTDALSETRFSSNDELRYSLRSLYKNLNWVRHIYIVSNCKPPSWFTETPTISFVSHEEIISEACLPTFNSHAIESCLHKIPRLSENFIYLNDDVFIGRPLFKEFFIDEAGRTRSFMEPYAMVSGEPTLGDPDYLNASRNSQRLLREKFGVSCGQLHLHTSFSLKKSVLSELEETYSEDVERVRNNRFREASDINLTSFLYHHFALLTKEGVFAKCSQTMIKNSDPAWTRKLKALSRNLPEIFCINEGGKTAPSQIWQTVIRDFLDAKFPDPAPWECAEDQKPKAEN